MSKVDTRTRMVNSAITLLRERGANGVSIDAVLAHSGAPRGSVYHHFPGGRDEIVLTAANTAADFITKLIDEAAASNDPRRLIEQFVAFWNMALTASDYRAGCPIVSLAVDSREDQPEATELVRLTFADWHAKVAALLRRNGLTPKRASARATLAIAAIEGAVILCRAQRSSKPLDDVSAELVALLG